MITIAALDKDGGTIIVDEVRGRTKALKRLAWFRREDPFTIFFLL